MTDPDVRPQLQIRLQRIDATSVVFVAGELDISSVGELASALEPMDGPLIVDLGGVSFMDSSGIRTIVVARKRLQKDGRSLLLRAPQPHIRQLLEITGLDTIIV
jgi:anti-sigma B factor antagonist